MYKIISIISILVYFITPSHIYGKELILKSDLIQISIDLPDNWNTSLISSGWRFVANYDETISINIQVGYNPNNINLKSIVNNLIEDINKGNTDDKYIVFKKVDEIDNNHIAVQTIVNGIPTTFGYEKFDKIVVVITVMGKDRRDIEKILHSLNIHPNTDVK